MQKIDNKKILIKNKTKYNNIYNIIYIIKL